MNGETSIVLMTRASQMLAEADTIQKAKELKNLALTAAEWAKRKGLGEEAVLHARSYALEAERKIGEMLSRTELGRGKRTDLVPSGNQVDDRPILAELGLTKKESSRAQMLAQVNREDFDAVKAGEKTIMEIRRELKKKSITEQPPMPEDKFRVIYADPPWKYSDTRGLGRMGGNRS